MSLMMEKTKTVSITAYLKDFEGDGRQWQESYFRLLSLKNTWGIIRSMDILDHRVDGAMQVYVWLLLNSEANEAKILEHMEELGYRNIKTIGVTMGEVEYDGLDVDYLVEA